MTALATISDELINGLLWESEGPALDFKAEQYRISHESDHVKSELIKDVLAFANASRRQTAFILTGVRDGKGSRAEIVGVHEKLDDATVQQLVNANAQRPIEFSYQNYEIEEKTIGVFCIPCQARPFHLTKDYGHLKRGAVYVRRGSSTAEAMPDEIVAMGGHQSQKPALTLVLADRRIGMPIGTTQELKSTVLAGPRDIDIPDFLEPVGPFGLKGARSPVNKHYYRDLVAYTRLGHLLRPVTFAISNSGDGTASAVKCVMEIEDKAGWSTLLTEAQFPTSPAQNALYQLPRFGPLFARQSISINRFDNAWRVDCRFGDIHPKDTVLFPEDLLIGARTSVELVVTAKIYADNMAEPGRASCRLLIAAEERYAELKEYEGLRHSSLGVTLLKD